VQKTGEMAMETINTAVSKNLEKLAISDSGEAFWATLCLIPFLDGQVDDEELTVINTGLPKYLGQFREKGKNALIDQMYRPFEGLNSYDWPELYSYVSSAWDLPEESEDGDIVLISLDISEGTIPTILENLFERVRDSYWGFRGDVVQPIIDVHGIGESERGLPTMPEEGTKAIISYIIAFLKKISKFFDDNDRKDLLLSASMWVIMSDSDCIGPELCFCQEIWVTFGFKKEVLKNNAWKDKVGFERFYNFDIPTIFPMIFLVNNVNPASDSEKIFIAASNGDTVELTKIIEGGKNINKVSRINIVGQTKKEAYSPLTLAIANEHPDTVEMLLLKGATTCKNGGAKNCRKLAKKTNNKGIIDLIDKYHFPAMDKQDGRFLQMDVKDATNVIKFLLPFWLEDDQLSQKRLQFIKLNFSKTLGENNIDNSIAQEIGLINKNYPEGLDIDDFLDLGKKVPAKFREFILRVILYDLFETGEYEECFTSVSEEGTVDAVGAMAVIDILCQNYKRPIDVIFEGVTQEYASFDDVISAMKKIIKDR
jgi:hypothetical protein